MRTSGYSGYRESVTRELGFAGPSARAPYPAPDAVRWHPALLAQLVEHFHGKEGVVGSSPTEGSVCLSFVLLTGRFRGERRG
jgi:hypothetical protein